MEDVKSNYAEREQLKIKEIITDKVCYIPQLDEISMPCKEQFSDIKKRLDREIKNDFGSEKYSKEELVAEIGSTGLMNMLGLEIEDTFSNSTAYLQSWIQVFHYILNGK